MLTRVELSEAFAAAALAGGLGRANLSSRDAALASELVHGTLRWRGALDDRLRPLCRQPLEKLESVVRNGLRLGAYQLLGSLRVPAHAAVAETVGVVRDRRGRGAASLINAVLRRLAAAEPVELDPRAVLPSWLAERVGRSWTAGELDHLRLWSVEQPWTGLRVEPGPGPGRDRDSLAKELRELAPSATIEPGRFSPLALRTRGLGRLDDLAAFRRGRMTAQDEGAQACGLLLDVVPGHRVLDACAGRGGKTTLIAACSGSAASIDAADRNPRKLRQLQRELRRLGRPQRVRTVAVDLERGPGDLSPPYDRILLDAPCSGTGTLSRRPEIRWRLTPGDLERLVELQRRLLQRCLGLLAPDGALVYCVCSILDEEGREQVRALARTGDLRMTREISLFPPTSGTDGFYAARVVRS